MTNDTAPPWQASNRRPFGSISAASPPSRLKHEEHPQHVRRLAQERGFNVREDSAGNLLIEVPATRATKRANTVLKGTSTWSAKRTPAPPTTSTAIRSA